ncbi:hypothetical protein [Flaviflexus massiliensis]|uniref:hypothetical protein n=1 Tax=Flaviflexus massiliensis TaxID=1522309 RepID=UPI00164EB580|nr:hypothetical protein [Flaviflexus massiliensis]
MMKNPAESPILHFLFVYDRENDSVDMTEFGEDSERALDAYAEAERKYRHRKSFDIVLIGSDSLESVRETHSTYFKSEAHSSIDSVLNELVRMELNHSAQ